MANMKSRMKNFKISKKLKIVFSTILFILIMLLGVSLAGSRIVGKKFHNIL